MKVLVTGGCGFIGSNFINYLLKDPETRGAGIEQVANLDLQTYAGKGRNIEHMDLDQDPRYRLVLGDICDKSLVQRTFQKFAPDLVFHFAAESHVDRSIQDKNPFERTNVSGTKVLVEQALKQKTPRFVHISTDEVYGSIKEGSFSETSDLNPTNPYAETKVRAEAVVMDYMTRGLPALITRSANNYGPYQFPEKLLPLFITNLIKGEKVPLMCSPDNRGLNVRDWLNVADNCRAIWYVSQKGNAREIYNIPGNNEKSNMAMTQMLLKHFGFGEEMICEVEHRKQHDFRYSITGEKLAKLGFQYKHLDLNSEVTRLCSWYEQNQRWWKPLKKRMKTK
jgi:dTDP-glucose 4,6-dehydratase